MFKIILRPTNNVRGTMTDNRQKQIVIDHLNDSSDPKRIIITRARCKATDGSSVNVQSKSWKFLLEEEF